MYWAYMICAILGAILIRLPKMLAEENREEDLNPIVMGLVRNMGWILIFVVLILLILPSGNDR